MMELMGDKEKVLWITATPANALLPFSAIVRDTIQIDFLIYFPSNKCTFFKKKKKSHTAQK